MSTTTTATVPRPTSTGFAPCAACGLLRPQGIVAPCAVPLRHVDRVSLAAALSSVALFAFVFAHHSDLDASGPQAVAFALSAVGVLGAPVLALIELARRAWGGRRPTCAPCRAALAAHATTRRHAGHALLVAGGVAVAAFLTVMAAGRGPRSELLDLVVALAVFIALPLTFWVAVVVRAVLHPPR